MLRTAVLRSPTARMATVSQMMRVLACASAWSPETTETMVSVASRMMNGLTRFSAAVTSEAMMTPT